MPQFTHLTPPVDGTPLTRKQGQLVVPDDPIIPFIEGDGTGPDIWRASVRVFDAAVLKAYGGKPRKLRADVREPYDRPWRRAGGEQHRPDGRGVDVLVAAGIRGLSRAPRPR